MKAMATCEVEEMKQTAFAESGTSPTQVGLIPLPPPHCLELSDYLSGNSAHHDLCVVQRTEFPPFDIDGKPQAHNTIATQVCEQAGESQQ